MPVFAWYKDLWCTAVALVLGWVEIEVWCTAVVLVLAWIEIEVWCPAAVAVFAWFEIEVSRIAAGAAVLAQAEIEKYCLSRNQEVASEAEPRLQTKGEAANQADPVHRLAAARDLTFCIV